MPRILFVDDEPKLLSGLRRMLHGLRNEWSMEFVESGPEALHLLAERPFDIVVSDMRMPGMDGSELLRRVRERFPATVRLILSGQCDRRAVLKAVGPAHQFLTKPCSSATLKEALGRACQLCDHVPIPEAKRLASRVDSLPSTPESLSELTAELEAAQASMERAGRIIAKDPGMVARVLQLVNSGFFGTPQRTVDPRRAAELLGQERLRELDNSTDAFTSVGLTEPHLASFRDTIEHSRTVSEAAGRIAEAESDCPEVIADARWAGLLHDIGVLVFLQQAADRYADLLTASDHNTPFVQRERRTFGADHSTMGAYLLALWGLPDVLVRIVALHHVPGKSDDRGFTALTAVHVANVLSRNAPHGTPGRDCRLDHPYLERIGKNNRLALWTRLCRTVEREGVLT